MAEFHPVTYVEEHPYVAGAVIFGGGLLILWWLGFFGSGQQSTDSGSSNLAAAYYAAEANQATVGAQLQATQIQANAATKGAQIQADAAVSINNANQQTAQVIATSGYSAQVAEAQIAGNVSTVQSNDARLTAISHDQYAYQTAANANDTAQFLDIINNIAAPEIQKYGSVQFNYGGQQLTAAGSSWTPATATAAGYTPAQQKLMFGA